MCTYPSGRRHPQLVVDEPAAAVWMAQMNTVVFHPWPSRTANTDNPDQLRIDLDPQPGTDFADAVPAAHALREVLAEAGLVGWVKTSGNRGIHVFAPIEPSHEILDVRHAVIAAARELERRMPERVTTAWWKEERGQRIFVDFNQAARDRTIAGAYSPRATAVASVSCPVEWDELDAVVPSHLTVRTVPDRLATVGDPWEHMHDAPGRVDVLLQWWERDLANGLGELPFPPDYPKMPGEPMRVQPSRAKKPPAEE
jgi:DNA ligase D-like protein (predicted polymerase)